MKSFQRSRVSLRITPKFVFISFSFSFIVLSAFFYFYLVNTKKAYAAVSGDYRSIATGNWNSTSTWETYNGTSWVAAGTTPTSSNNVITIQNGHTVSAIANVTTDQVVVDAGGVLVIGSGKTLTLANGTGDDLIVNGTAQIY